MTPSIYNFSKVIRSQSSYGGTIAGTEHIGISTLVFGTSSLKKPSRTALTLSKGTWVKFPSNSWYMWHRVMVSTECVVAHESGIPDWLQIMVWGTESIEHYTENGSISSPAESANPGMLAVGAAPWHDTTTIQNYSSRGPTPDGRVKPDITGADCGATSLWPLDESNNAFCGTSQASAHLAGLAALVRQRSPDLIPAEVATYLKVNATQRESPDPNNNWGDGFAQLPAPPAEGACTNNPGIASDCRALLAARDSLAGSATLNWSANTPVDQWEGVALGDTPLRVTGLILPEKALTGQIPSGLGSLTNLRTLSLWGNQLTGTIPTQLDNLANLEVLVLSQNQLTGDIPTQLGNLANLAVLVLWGNELTGTIPARLGSLANLQWLYLSENQLTGTIPTELGNLTDLRELYLSDNQLTGDIPTQLGNLANLAVLVLWGNQLTGTIPAGTGQPCQSGSAGPLAEPVDRDDTCQAG